MPKITRTSSTDLDDKKVDNNLPQEECPENLIKANEEYAFEIKEKQKRVKELLIANKEMATLTEEKNSCEAELKIAKKKLIVGKKENHKQSQELLTTNEDLKKAKASKKDHIEGLKEMMFMTSHHLRQPVVQILGLADILNTTTNSPEELNEIVEHMKESAETLNDMTKELTSFIHHQEVKAKS